MQPTTTTANYNVRQPRRWNVSTLGGKEGMTQTTYILKEWTDNYKKHWFNEYIEAMIHFLTLPLTS